MNSVFWSRPPQSVRFIPSPRSAEMPRAKGPSRVQMMTSSDDGSTNLLMSSPKPRWSKSGVTNMGFKCDDDDDSPSPEAPSGSGHDDVMAPVTSPNVEDAIELYHSAVSRRKSFAEVTADVCPELESEAPPNGSTLPIEEVQAMALKLHNRSDGQVNSDVDDTGYDSVSLVTSSKRGVIKFEAKRSRSSSAMETNTRRSLSTKPRSLSQPLLKTVAFRNYSTLDSLSEEDIAIDERGISRLAKRGSQYETSTPLIGATAENLSEEDIAIDEGGISRPAKRGSQYETSTPLIGATAEKLTVYPGHQNENEVRVSNWQAKLNDEEPKLINKEPERYSHANKLPAYNTPTLPPAATSASSDSSYVNGCQVSIGDSVPMTEASNAPSEVEGIEAAVGSSTGMSEIMESPPYSASASASYTSTGQGETVLSMDMQRANAGRRRKSLKAIFRLGFLTTKNKKKNKADGNISPEILSPDAGPQPSGSRITQRRMSRLEMNEPIEDIFSEVKFETMQKRTSTSTTDATIGDYDITDDDDVIEDPEVILKSIIDSNASVDDENDNLCFHDDVTKLSCSEICDVIDPQSPEKQLLLPVKDRNRQLTTVGEEDPKTSEDDFR